MKKCSKKERDTIQERLQRFFLNPFNPALRNHSLKGKYVGYRSIDLRPDLRAIYKQISDKEVIFVLMGTHNQLYKK